MNYSEQFKEHIEYTFNGFCKTALYHEALNAYRDLQREQRHEISLEYIVTETTFEPSGTDEYFQAAYKTTEFQVRGQTVVIDDERLAVALSMLSAHSLLAVRGINNKYIVVEGRNTYEENEQNSIGIVNWGGCYNNSIFDQPKCG